MIWFALTTSVSSVNCKFKIVLQTGFGGWASEATVNGLRVSVLRSLLHRDAAYFDQPRRSNAACVTNLSLNAPNVNAVSLILLYKKEKSRKLQCLDYRFMLLINNVVALIVCLLLTYLNNWQIGVTSTVLTAGFIMLLTVFSIATDKALEEKETKDTTAEVSPAGRDFARI